MRIIFLVLIFTTFSGCKTGRSTATIPPSAEKVTVTDYRELDGCTFLLVRENGEKLQPVNLETRYQVNGLRLYVTYKNRNEMSICMAGKMVELTFTAELK